MILGCLPIAKRTMVNTSDVGQEDTTSASGNIVYYDWRVEHQQGLKSFNIKVLFSLLCPCEYKNISDDMIKQKLPFINFIIVF